MMTLFDDEPLEVCILKKQLANLSCKCSVCEKPESEYSGSYRERYKHSNKEVQSEGDIDEIFGINNRTQTTQNAKFDFLCNNVSCAGCFIALNLLKAKEPKVCKDEETETKSGLSCCDKSIGKCVKFMERTTSTSSVAKPTSKNSNSPCNGKNTLEGIMKKRSTEHVTFSDNLEMQSQEVQAFYGQCFCLQNFMESIRPPLDN